MRDFRPTSPHMHLAVLTYSHHQPAGNSCPLLNALDKNALYHLLFGTALKFTSEFELAMPDQFFVKFGTLLE